MKIHVFIDAENVPVTNALETYDVLSESGASVCDVVGKEDTLAQAYLKRRDKNFRINNCNYGKNSADLYLTVLIAKAIYEEPDTDIFAILSNDRDFVPVIQLAVEKRKQVLLLGLEAQSKGLMESLERQGVDMDYVTLGVIDGMILSESITVEDLPNGLFEYYRKHYKGSTIFVKRGAKLVEVPFIDGMHANIFLDLMRRCGIWTRSQRLEDEIDELFLQVVNKRIYFIGGSTPLHWAIEKMPSDLRGIYEQQYTGGTIFVTRLDGETMELPFINGMHLSRLTQLMRHFGVWTRGQKMKATLARLEELGLRLKGDCVFRAV